VPQECKDEPSLADNIAELIRDGRTKEAQDLLTQFQAGHRFEPSTAVKAKPNADGTTQDAIHVPHADGRATVGPKGARFNVDSPEGQAQIGFAKKHVSKLTDQAVIASHKPVTGTEFKIEGGTILNTDRAERRGEMDEVKREHVAFIHRADPETEEANWRAIAVREERAMRLAGGKGTASDLAFKINSMK